MATTATLTERFTMATKLVPVEIDVDLNTRTIKVSPDPFRVSKREKEEVIWICKQQHKHDHNKCFLVHFGEHGSPFAGSTFVNHEARSGHAVVQPDFNKLYKYTVWVPGCEPLDPQGGVTP